MNHPGGLQRTLATLIVSAGWFAVTFQFYLIIVNRTTAIGETIIRFFSFFTILTNILVAVCFTALLFFSRSKWSSYFAKPRVLTAVTLYITVVGLVYNLILRFLWKPQGLQLLVDELLHLVVPLLVLLYWSVFVSKKELQWKQLFPWMIYPFAYCIYILARGTVSGFYPYPFIDVAQLGYAEVLRNIAILVLVFFGFGALFIAIGRVSVNKLATMV